MVTDPPYGVDYDPEWRHRRGVNKSEKRGKIQNDGQADWSAAWALFPGEIAYVWHGALRSTIVADSLFKSGFSIRAQIIWAKERLVMSQGDYHWQHEPCWYDVRKKGNWMGDRKPRPNTRRKSLSSACAGQCSTIPAPARRCTSRFPGAARR
jgi:DNA modification methylase